MRAQKIKRKQKHSLQSDKKLSDRNKENSYIKLKILC